MKLQIDIVSAEGQIHLGEADRVFAPAEMGEVGITPRHSPLLTRLKPGQIRVELDGVQTPFYVSGGILEIQPHRVTVLADTAIRAKDIDEAAATEAKRKAEEMLANQKGEFDLGTAQAMLAEAVAQLKAVEQLRKMANRS